MSKTRNQQYVVITGNDCLTKPSTVIQPTNLSTLPVGLYLYVDIDEVFHMKIDGVEAIFVKYLRKLKETHPDLLDLPIIFMDGTRHNVLSFDRPNAYPDPYPKCTTGTVVAVQFKNENTKAQRKYTEVEIDAQRQVIQKGGLVTYRAKYYKQNKPKYSTQGESHTNSANKPSNTKPNFTTGPLPRTHQFMSSFGATDSSSYIDPIPSSPTATPHYSSSNNANTHYYNKPSNDSPSFTAEPLPKVHKFMDPSSADFSNYFGSTPSSNTATPNYSSTKNANTYNPNQSDYNFDANNRPFHTHANNTTQTQNEYESTNTSPFNPSCDLTYPTYHVNDLPKTAKPKVYAVTGESSEAFIARLGEAGKTYVIDNGVQLTRIDDGDVQSLVPYKAQNNKRSIFQAYIPESAHIGNDDQPCNDGNLQDSKRQRSK